ncbi:hypothetical protein B0O80DRAFT_76241 [Mortierella sp. GBAus27b]|nr:hypothetical protein B0O80DRAFT_76241 [Mortierella sp. GBAus27b]
MAHQSRGCRWIRSAPLSSSSPWASSSALIAPLFALAIGCLSVSTAAPPPSPVSYASYATVGERSLFIRGGSSSINGPALMDQFFSLDLYNPTWDSTNVPWNNLSSTITTPSTNSNLGSYGWRQLMTVSGEQDRLLVFNPDSTVSSYGLKTGVWNTVAMKPSALPVGSLQNLTAVADPYTTSVYIPSGYNNGQEMLVYDYATNTYRTESTPALLKATVSMDPLIRYGFAWCESRRTMLLYGGTRASSGPKDSPSMFEYNPGNSQWALVSTGGDFPGDLNSHCMVSAANGTKMVVFGGQNQYNQLSGSIFILDVSTMVWKKGPDLDPSLVRTGMVTINGPT